MPRSSGSKRTVPRETSTTFAWKRLLHVVTRPPGAERGDLHDPSSGSSKRRCHSCGSISRSPERISSLMRNEDFEAVKGFAEAELVGVVNHRQGEQVTIDCAA